jgi:hypothetical protein
MKVGGLGPRRRRMRGLGQGRRGIDSGELSLNKVGEGLLVEVSP